MKIKLITCLFLVLMAGFYAAGQQALIKGRISDIVNKESLAGALFHCRLPITAP
ncbi:MAG: hypothetical protein WDO16_05945 [Bacteroidota bacterium]